MNSMKEKEVIRNFWKWFKTVSSNLASINPNPETIEKLDQWISLLGDYGWEIGTGSDQKTYFALSSNGDKELMKSAKEIMTLAPKVRGFKFLPAKPPKEWKPIWEMEDSKGNRIKINAENWRYLLYEYDNGSIDIVIGADNINNFNEDIQFLAVEVVVEGMLGEEKFTHLIENIELSLKFTDEEYNKSNNIQYLRKHIDEMFRHS